MYKLGNHVARCNVVFVRNKLGLACPTFTLEKTPSNRHECPSLGPQGLQLRPMSRCPCKGGQPPCPPPVKSNNFLKGLLSLLCGMLVGGLLADWVLNPKPPKVDTPEKKKCKKKPPE